MRVSRESVEREREWLLGRAPETVGDINEVRTSLGAAFNTDVDDVTESQYEAAVEELFADTPVAVNVTALLGLLKELDVAGDYPGFVIDERLGRWLAATIAGGEPLSTLAEATFHYADVHTHGEEGDPAGQDDLEAALAAGFQTRLPG